MSLRAKNLTMRFAHWPRRLRVLQRRPSAHRTERWHYALWPRHSPSEGGPSKLGEGSIPLESSFKSLWVSSLRQISSVAIRLRPCRLFASKLLTAMSACCSCASILRCVLRGSRSKSTCRASRQTKSALPNDQFRSISKARRVACARSLAAPSPAPLAASPSTNLSAARPARHILSFASASLGVIVGRGAGVTCPPRAVTQAPRGVGKGDNRAAIRCPASWTATRRSRAGSSEGAISSTAASKCRCANAARSARALPSASRAIASAVAPGSPRISGDNCQKSGTVR